MSARSIWTLLLVFAAPMAAPAQEMLGGYMVGDTVVAPAPVQKHYAHGTVTDVERVTIDAGARMARELGFESLEAVMPSCFEATVAAMAEIDDQARIRYRLNSARTPYRTNGNPKRIIERWAQDIRVSCDRATAEWLLVNAQEHAERPPSAEWEAVWHAVIAPMRSSRYWTTRWLRNEADSMICAQYDALCVLSQQSQRAIGEGRMGSEDHERNRPALAMVAAAGLTEKEAESLARFAYAVMMPDLEYQHRAIAELVCNRLRSFETAAAVGRALDEARDAAMPNQEQLYRGIASYLSEETIEKLRRYVVAHPPEIRFVDYERWYSKFSLETALSMGLGTCTFLQL